jgi:hypothetical protein
MSLLKQLAKGSDYSVWTTTFGTLVLSCTKCEWEIDLDKLDTLEDIWNELEVHGDVNHGTKANN